ncbi:trypsin, partial [Acinetobacter baumannii]
VDSGDYFEVVFSNGNRSEAELLGSDIYTDLAVLKVSDVTVDAVAEFGSTEDLQVGQTVIAIGNPLGLNFAGSATSGIVSGKDRTV